MNISNFISKRYLFAKKSRNIINLISLISLFGLLVSAASLVVILSGFNGIQKYVEDAIAEEIIKSNVQEGDSITMDIGKNDTELNVKISSPKKSEEQ